jgi:23S rRNA (guanosine2251-2'-O)-methyltransferase
MMKLNAKQLRTTEPDINEYVKIPKNDIYIILDNVLDTYNTGSIFRLADAVAAKKVLLCGETLTPPNTRIKKASINTWQLVEWEYKKTALDAVNDLKNQSAGWQTMIKIISVEQDSRSVDFQKVQYSLPVAIVVGNETYGVSKDVLDVSDMIVELPMWGINKSLNVMVSCGIILYEIMKQHRL